jgi:hypothetical protein
LENEPDLIEYIYQVEESAMNKKLMQSDFVVVASQVGPGADNKAAFKLTKGYDVLNAIKQVRVKYLREFYHAENIDFSDTSGVMELLERDGCCNLNNGLFSINIIRRDVTGHYNVLKKNGVPVGKVKIGLLM